MDPQPQLVQQPVLEQGVGELVAWLPPELDEAAAAAAAAGVGVESVGPYRISNPGPGGLIVGYATATEQAIAGGPASWPA